MRIFNVAKIGVLLLCILLTLPMMTGCANDVPIIPTLNGCAGALLEPDETKWEKQELLEQVEKKWYAVITNEENLVAKVKITSYIPQPPTIEFQPSQSEMYDDVEQINMIVDLLNDTELEFQNLPSDQESFDAHVSSQYGKETYAIGFYDSQDQKILRLKVNEDNVAEIYEPYSGGWKSVCIARFSVSIFDTIKGVFDNLE